MSRKSSWIKTDFLNEKDTKNVPTRRYKIMRELKLKMKNAQTLYTYINIRGCNVI